jgi:hypothetical protein
MNNTMFFSPLLSSKISEIGNLYFNYNRLLDAGMDYLDIEVDMSKFSEIIHTIAHKAPTDADAFRDFNANNNCRTDYGSDIQGSEGNYESPIDFCIHAFSYSVLILQKISEGIDFAEKENNIEMIKFLQEQIPVAYEYKKQFTVFNNKILELRDQDYTWGEIDEKVSEFLLMDVKYGGGEDVD